MKPLRTKVDELCYFLEESEGHQASLDDIKSFVGLEEEAILDIVDILSKAEVVELVTKPLDGRFIKLKRIIPFHEERAKTAGKIVEEYTVHVYGVKGYVEIIESSDEPVNRYVLTIPRPGPYTSMFMNVVKDMLARQFTVSVEELSDPKKRGFVVARFTDHASVYFNRIPGLNQRNRKVLMSLLFMSMYGLGDLEFLLADPDIEDVGINGAFRPVSVYHKRYGWLKTNLSYASEDEIFNIASQIGRKSGRDITLASPIMDAHLITGDRAAATLFPVSTSGNTLTIRKFARDPWTITDFISPKIHTLSTEMAAFLWMCIHYEINILVGGGTASGKTSLLNTLAALIPPKERIISIEDTREINLPEYLSWNWIPLTTKPPNTEGRGEVTMDRLIQSSLRMRPDRIIIGEIRNREEAEVAFEAMHTGHSVLSTLHSDTSTQIIRRLSNEPFNIPATELSTLQVIVIQYRDRRTGVRRTYEITEIREGPRATVSLNRLYLWHPRKDSFEKSNKSLRVMEELNLHTGMTPKELDKELKEKEKILKWMLKNDISNVNDVGIVASLYYRDPDHLRKAVSKRWNFNQVIDRW